MSSPQFLARLPALALAALMLAATGCVAVKPQPITAEQMLASARSAPAETQRGVEPLTAPLSLEEALARAFKYNLNQRTVRMEQAIALNVWKAGNFDLMPRALAAAGYHNRDRETITRSRDSVTGAPSLAHPYISSDREYALYDLGFSWSVIDLTTGYYGAKQNADRVLIAAEHRRKAMHVLTREVTIAFWKMVSAQNLLADVREVLATADAALADAGQARTEGLRGPIDNLRYQRQLLENVRLLAGIEKEFSTARATLANLINVPLTSEFAVVEPTQGPNVRILEVPVERMEELALLRNADLREQFYQERVAAQEVRKTIAKLFPNLSLNYNLRYDTDRYLINQTWSEAGLQLAQNLTSLLSLPAQKRSAKAGVELARQRRLAAQMTLLAQVHIARLELASTHRQLELADRIWEIDQGIKHHTANRQEAQAESKLARVAADTASIVSMLRRYQALAEFNAAAGALQSTLGVEIDADRAAAQPLPELTRSIAEWQRAWQSGMLPTVPSAAVSSHPRRG